MPLSDAQGVARSLQCDRLLLGFFANRSAWSLVDVEKGEVLHKYVLFTLGFSHISSVLTTENSWRNPEIDPSRYSMHALSTTPCVALHALSLRQQLATQYTAEDIVMPGSLDKLFANFASWASSAYEDFQDDSSKTPIRDAQAYRSDIWKSVNAMLPLLYGEAATTMPKREYRVEGSFCIARRDFMNDNALGSNFLPDVLAKLAVSMIVKANKPGQSAEPEMTSKSTAVSENTNINIDNRLTCIEERLERLADALQQRQASDVCDLKSLLRPLSPALIVLLLGLVLFFYTDRQPCIS